MLTQRELFLKYQAQTSDSPMMLEIIRAEGLYMYDISGKRYTDLISGISVSNIGHCHPKVVKAVKEQVDKYMHLMVYGEYIQSPQINLAKLLSEILPKELNSTYFVNSGSEAVEGALKLAKRYTGRTEIIACKDSYHGSTHGSLSVMGNEKYKNSFRPLLPDIKFIEFNNIKDIEQISNKTACVIIETVQGEAGVITADEAYFNLLRKKCNEKGTLLILDEIQTGFGRTGSMFGFEQYNITPDILCVAKAMGGGMPIGAFISSNTIMNSLTNNPILGHITTFGGHPVSCAASYAALEVLINEKITDSVKEKETLFKTLLIHPLIKGIRSKGLLMAVEFESAEMNFKIINECINNGVIVDWFLFNDKNMRIAPPLIITKNEIIQTCETIINCMNVVSKNL